MPYVIRKSGSAGKARATDSAKPATQRVKLPPPVRAPRKPATTIIQIIQQPQPTNN